MDPELFDALGRVVANGRSVRALEETGTIDGRFSGECLTSATMPWHSRPVWRSEWFDRVRDDLADADIVFADPDNGLVDDSPRRPTRKTFGKQMPLSEAKALANGRVAVIYHHNTRRTGGHDAEVDHWIGQLGDSTIAVRANAYSCRTFFIVNPDNEMIERAKSFCEKWTSHPLNISMRLAEAD